VRVRAWAPCKATLPPSGQPCRRESLATLCYGTPCPDTRVLPRDPSTPPRLSSPPGDCGAPCPPTGWPCRKRLLRPAQPLLRAPDTMLAYAPAGHTSERQRWSLHLPR